MGNREPSITNSQPLNIPRQTTRTRSQQLEAPFGVAACHMHACVRWIDATYHPSRQAGRVGRQLLATGQVIQNRIVVSKKVCRIAHFHAGITAPPASGITRAAPPGHLRVPFPSRLEVRVAGLETWSLAPSTRSKCKGSIGLPCGVTPLHA